MDFSDSWIRALRLGYSTTKVANFHSETYHEKKAKRFRGEFSVKPRIVIEELRN